MPKPKGKSKYSEKQMKIARVAEPRDKITGADFKAMKGYEDGGEVYARVPMEPDEEMMKKIEAEQAKSGVSMTEVEISDKAAGKGQPASEDLKYLKSMMDRDKYPSKGRRGDDEPVKTYRDGGMVRGCKGIQVKGKKFSGTF